MSPTNLYNPGHLLKTLISVGFPNLIRDTKFSLEVKHRSMLQKAINQRYGLPLRKAR